MKQPKSGAAARPTGKKTLKTSQAAREKCAQAAVRRFRQRLRPILEGLKKAGVPGDTVSAWFVGLLMKSE